MTLFSVPLHAELRGNQGNQGNENDDTLSVFLKIIYGFSALNVRNVIW